MRSLLVLLGAAVWVGACAGGAASDVSHMVASYYNCYQPGECSKSKRTANGERFDPNGFTAAHRTYAFGTSLRVCYRGCVVVRVNDRGPFVAGRSLDLSEGAARAIGLTGVGTATVRVERL